MKNTKRIILSCAALLAFCLGVWAWEDGALPGAFTINEKGDKIQFSQGNLQFNAVQGTHATAEGPLQGTWRFAENQWDLCSIEANNNKAADYDGWFDRFLFGTSGNPYPPYKKSISDNGTFSDAISNSRGLYDWGRYNAISNGGNEVGLWRTLSDDEWEYLLFHHQKEIGTVNNVIGLIILPEDWQLPDGLYLTTNPTDWSSNTYNENSWRKMEAAGAVFLPCQRDDAGFYWTSRALGGIVGARELYIRKFSLGITEEHVFYITCLVRLVKKYTEPEPEPVTKELPGLFSVAEGKQVIFSQGNLQYKASTDTWRFAENQYDAQGDKNSNIAEDYTDFIDIFGWGTSGFNGKNPWMTSTSSTDYGDGTNDIAGTDYDWGVYNSESITNNAGLKWRTLTADEWYYLFSTRPNRGAGRATACNMHGYIILPDNWTLPEGLEFTKNAQTWDVNVYDADDWAKMEQAGAVFLPAAGYRYGATEYKGLGEWGYYWTSSAKNDNDAVSFYFAEYAFDADWSMGRENGYSVRLVSDVLRKKGDVNGDDKVNTAYVVAVYTYIEKGDASGFTRDACDVNGDSSVNTADVVAIYTAIIGSSTE